MEIKIYPRPLHGTVTPPPSKSLLHREMIACALSGAPIPQLPTPLADDVARTQTALSQLLGDDPAPVVDCGASGSTLRFLLPVFMARGKRACFTGTPRLLERPLPAGLPCQKTEDSILITGRLTGGEVVTSGAETSQLISGLLFSLPLCSTDAHLRLTGELVSRPYVEMTRSVLSRYQIVSKPVSDGWQIPGGQIYVPAAFSLEADWSAAAWFLVLSALKCAVFVQKLDKKSTQGDREIARFLKKMGQTVSLSDCPDLLPPLALLGALQAGKTTVFTGVGRLRGKESDRLSAVSKMLNALGGKALAGEDTLTVTGVSAFRGGVTLDSRNDHRLAFLAGCAAPFCQAPVRLKNAESVCKSYPNFWSDYVNLGGKIEEVSL
jgi:3-phosphoshikimate 1-carboxyvinyltransferase